MKLGSDRLVMVLRCIHFVPEWCGEEGAEGAGEGETCAAQSWALGSVARVCPRRWCLQERAAELFLLSGHAHLLAFAATPERDAFLRALDAAHLPNRYSYFVNYILRYVPSVIQCFKQSM